MLIKKRPFYAAYIDYNGELHSDFFECSCHDCTSKLFYPVDNEILTIIPFEVKGRTYRERQEHARDLAIRFQSEQRPGLSWGEIAAITDFFYTVGRRYGLLREFRENCIC